MKKVFLLIQFIIVMTISLETFATIVAPSDEEVRANCYPGSPMLQSDVCWGKTYTEMNPGSYNFPPMYSMPNYFPYYNPYMQHYYVPGQIDISDRYYQPKLQYMYPGYNNYYMPTYYPSVYQM